MSRALDAWILKEQYRAEKAMENRDYDVTDINDQYAVSAEETGAVLVRPNTVTIDCDNIKIEGAGGMARVWISGVEYTGIRSLSVVYEGGKLPLVTFVTIPFKFGIKPKQAEPIEEGEEWKQGE